MTKRRLTQRATEWEQQGNGFVPWEWPDSNDPFVFKGNFYHEGVDLTADEVLSIMANQVFDDAKAWAAKLSEDPAAPALKFAGIDFIGPVDGEWWEDKGTKGDVFTGKRRYHKFAGNGTAQVLTFAR